jgi:hypothetical protein
MGINQQKKAMMKQRLTSSVSIFFTSPYLVIKTIPRAAIPTTTIDQPTINHLKKSDKTTSSSEKQNFKCEVPRPQAGTSRKGNIFLIVPLDPAYKAGAFGTLAGQNPKTKSMPKAWVSMLSLMPFQPWISYLTFDP